MGGKSQASENTFENPNFEIILGGEFIEGRFERILIFFINLTLIFNVFMKKLLFIFVFIGFISINTKLQAQYCAMILCEDFEDSERGLTNLYGVFSRFGEEFLNSYETMVIYTRLQGYSLDKAHVYYVEIVDPYDNLVIESNAFAFIFEDPTEVQGIRSRLGFTIEYLGTYKLRCYVDDILQQELLFTVGK